MAKVLVVDDEKLIVKGLSSSLTHEGYEVDCAYDGEEALSLIASNDYDIVLLDVMLPKIGGFEVCKRIRETSSLPVIMLTARDDDSDKIEGLETGADDYVTKPFNFRELNARIKNALRHSGKGENVSVQKTSKLSFNNICLDTLARSLVIGGNEINLTVREFDILELLMRNPGKVYGRDELLKILWKDDGQTDGRTVDVHVRRLREKIEANPAEPTFVHTKWGVGYYFSV